MGVKTSAGVSIDREVVEAVWGVASAAANAMNDSIPQLKTSCTYLASEENVGGSVAESFREMNRQVGAFLDDMSAKTAVVSKTLGKLAEALSISFTSTTKNSEQARNDLAVLVQKQKQVGK